MRRAHLIKRVWGSLSESGPGWTQSVSGYRTFPACGQKHGKVAEHPKDATCRKCLAYTLEIAEP